MPGVRSYWVAPVTPLTYTDGTAFTSATTLTDISPAASRPTPVPELGTCLRLRAFCEVTTTSATPTLTLGFYWGGVAAANPVASGAGLVMPASITAGELIIEYEGEFRALGAAGQIYGAGRVFMPSSLTAFATPVPVPQTAAARLVTVSTLTGLQVTVGALWSSVTGSPSITCRHFLAELAG